MMHGGGKSDFAIVAMKPANKVAPRCGAVRGGVSRSGVGGAKGGDQGECGPANHALDSAPGSRVTGAGAHVASIAVWTRGRSRMRESRKYGSVRGALSNERPYRDGQPKSWCGPAGESPAPVRSSVRLVASVAWSLATVAAKRTQRLHGSICPTFCRRSVQRRKQRCTNSVE